MHGCIVNMRATGAHFLSFLVISGVRIIVAWVSLESATIFKYMFNQKSRNHEF